VAVLNLQRAHRHNALHAEICVLIAFVCSIFSAAVEAFPDKPVRLVVPYREGGSSDVVARLLSLRLTELWGQPVAIENLPGSRSIFGTQQVATAEADGHTLLVANAALAINEALWKKLPYHPLRDFAPISRVATQHLALVLNANGPFTSFAQMTALAQVKGRQISYGSPGHGSVGHLAGELLKLVTSANLIHVAYSGTRQTIRELMASHVSCAMLPLSSVMPYVNAGRLRVLAVTNKKRAAALPEVPTIGESFPGYEVNNWVGIFAPYGATVTLVRTINSNVAAVVEKPAFKELLSSLGYEAAGSTPGELQMRLTADIERYSRIVFSARLTTQQLSSQMGTDTP
jgi:tripartite-type tricarboxylate transporter receptor subunit TctC